jgi:hypothetical protein
MFFLHIFVGVVLRDASSGTGSMIGNAATSALNPLNSHGLDAHPTIKRFKQHFNP